MAPRRDPMGRARREARRFAREARRLGTVHRRRLPEEARSAIEEAARDLEEAAAGEDRERLSGAVQRLDGLWEKHLASFRKGWLREYLESVAAAVLVALFLRAFVVEAFKIPSGSMVPTLLVGDHIFVSKVAYGPLVPFTTRRLLTLGSPRRGDVIVFENPREAGKDFVKRVVGIPGDVVEIRDQVLYVNGVAQPRRSMGDLTYDERNESTGRWWSDTCQLYAEEIAVGPIPRSRSDATLDPRGLWARAALAGVASHDVLQCRRSRDGEREGPFEVVAPGHVFVLGDNRDRSADSRGEGGWQVPFGNIQGRATLIWWSWGKGGSLLGRGEGLRVDRLFKRIE